MTTNSNNKQQLPTITNSKKSFESLVVGVAVVVAVVAVDIALVAVVAVVAAVAVVGHFPQEHSSALHSLHELGMRF